MLSAILAFLIFFLLAGSALMLIFYREALAQRLTTVLQGRAGHSSAVMPKLRQAAESLGVAAGSIQKVVPKSEKEISLARKRLVRAGLRQENAANIFYASKALVPMALLVFATATGIWHLNPFIVFAACIVFGYLLPDFALDHRIRTRAEQIRLALPDVLDLMVVCLEAGLSLDSAVLRAADELRPTHPAITDELGLVILEVRAGRSRVDAWRSLADRVALDGIRILVSILVQADQFGTGVSKTLRTYAETMRTSRRQRVEELAAKTSVKLVIPLLLFIFPTLWVVVLGPAIITLTENLKL